MLCFKSEVIWGHLFLNGENNFSFLKNHNLKMLCPNFPIFGSGQEQNFCCMCTKLCVVPKPNNCLFRQSPFLVFPCRMLIYSTTHYSSGTAIMTDNLPQRLPQFPLHRQYIRRRILTIQASDRISVVFGQFSQTNMKK